MTDTERLDVLGSKYAVEILAAAAEPKTANELSDQLDIPIATCYRRIDQLRDHGLLEVTDVTLSDRHQQCRRFQRTIEGLTLSFDDSVTVRYGESSRVKSP